MLPLSELNAVSSQIRHIPARVVPMRWVRYHQLNFSSVRMWAKLIRDEKVLGAAWCGRTEGDHIPVAIRAGVAPDATTCEPYRGAAGWNNLVYESEDCLH